MNPARDHDHDPPPPRRLVTTPRVLMAFAATVAALATITAVFSQAAGWDLSWRTFSGGGGRSTGGNYELSGVIGQSVVGRSSGGNYLVDSGHLGGGVEKYRRFLPAVASDGAP